MGARLPVTGPDALWAAFDPAFYRARVPQARDFDDAAAESHYRDIGQGEAISPNIYFDEAAYLDRYADVARMVREGRYASGFAHYRSAGYETRAPHWAYDDETYRRFNPDLDAAALAASGFVNRYDHFLRHGSAEGRVASLLIDPPALAALAGTGAPCPFRCYLELLWQQTRPLPATSALFDEEWYLRRYPEAAEALERGAVLCGLHHYLTNRRPSDYDPHPAFSERYYRDRYVDVDHAIRNGALRNGYTHFLEHGARELRTPHPAIDLAAYVAARPALRAALEEGRETNPLRPMLAGGALRLRTPASERAEPGGEAEAKRSFRLRAELAATAAAATPLRFDAADAALSVILVLHNQFALTLAALASLHATYPGPLQVILVDSGSTDETRFLERYVKGTISLRLGVNVGFVRACNVGLARVAAPFVLFLNNDVELGPDAVAAALRRLRGDASVGAVGGRIVRPHGALQEAGCIVWRDGTTAGYRRDATPIDPEASFVREVDYCSAAFLMCRSAAVARLGGFDDAFAPAYYEDVDLCFSLRAAGLRVVFDPACVVHHLEYGSETEPGQAAARMAANRAVFAAKHAPALAARFRPHQVPLARARHHADAEGRRGLLFIEDQVPLRRLGSGFVRSNAIIRALAEAGHAVTVAPMRRYEGSAAVLRSEFPEEAEILWDCGEDDLPALLAERPGCFETIWIARTHNAAKLHPALNALAGAAAPGVIVDTEAVASRREAARARLRGAPFDPGAALEAEFRAVPRSWPVIAASAAEAADLRAAGFGRVAVIGHGLPARRDASPGFAARRGLLFVGAIHEAQSPNLDSLLWFAEAVLPRLAQLIGPAARLTVVGHVAAGVDLGPLARHPLVDLAGPADALAGFYDAHRVFVAPTRFAAGLPYKVHEAASFGLPVAATALIADQLGWPDREAIAAADPADAAAFANAVAALHEDAALWARVREGARARVAAEASERAFRASVRAALALVAPPPARMGMRGPPRHAGGDDVRAYGRRSDLLFRAPS